MFKLFVDHNADINAPENIKYYTPLHVAADRGL